MESCAGLGTAHIFHHAHVPDVQKNLSVPGSEALEGLLLSRRSFWRDTGSFRLAFRLAGRAAEFMQVKVRPGVALDERMALLLLCSYAVWDSRQIPHS